MTEERTTVFGAMTEAGCKIAGPYLPVGDTEFVCTAHGDVVGIVDYPRADGVVSKAMVRCPVAVPRRGDPPHEYESRS